MEHRGSLVEHQLVFVGLRHSVAVARLDEAAGAWAHIGWAAPQQRIMHIYTDFLQSKATKIRQTQNSMFNYINCHVVLRYSKKLLVFETRWRYKQFCSLCEGVADGCYQYSCYEKQQRERETKVWNWVVGFSTNLEQTLELKHILPFFVVEISKWKIHFQVQIEGNQNCFKLYKKTIYEHHAIFIFIFISWNNEISYVFNLSGFALLGFTFCVIYRKIPK